MRKAFRKITKIKRKESFLKNRFFLLGVGLAALADLLLYAIVLAPFFQVQEVWVQGNAEVSEYAVKSVVLDRLWEQVLFLPTSSIFLIDEKSIKHDLLEAIPELEAARIQRNFPSALTVAVRERNRAAVWCQESYCVAIDSSGIAFQRTEPLAEDIVIRGAEQPLNLKEEVVEKDILDAVLYFAKEVKRRSLVADGALSFEIIPDSQIQAHTGEGWSVIFTNTQDLSWQIAKLQTVLENKIPFEKRKKLEYIDVRFGNQAYFKYR